MPLLTPDTQPPKGEKVKWEVQIPGSCMWTVEVEAITEEEAIALASKKVEEDTTLEPDDNPEPEYTDAEAVSWELIDPPGEEDKSAA